MLVQEFIDSIGKEPPAPVYLLCPGKSGRAKTATFESFLADQAVDRFVDRYMPPEYRDLAYAAFYADETSPQQIVMEAETLPFLTERRVILVRNAERFNTESAAERLLSYLETPCETTILLLVASRIDKRTKFYRACEKAGKIVECPELNAREAEDWVRSVASDRGKRLDSGALREFVARAGTHLSDLNNALTIVCSYVGEADRITEADIVAACADVAEEEIWALTDAIAISSTGKALASLRKLVDLGKHPDELMGIINWLLTSAYAVAVAGDGQPRISPFVARKVAPLANKLGIRKLRDAFALCTDTHFMLRTTGVDSNLAMELLVVKLAAPRKTRASA